MEEEDPLIAQCRTRVGRLISGKWRLDALIGVGGMAAVYMATHRNGSVGAIKILHDEVALNDEVRERFLREAYIANKVGHPGTVKVLDDDKDENDTPYLVMELLQGESVEGLAEKHGGRLSITETLKIVDATLAVLEAAHAQKIVHRDLKPENLFMTRDRTLKVLDFGIARLREENARKTQTGMVMGTPSFMAPEQAMGRWKDVDQRTDLYAVGATAFTLLTGLPVHEAETAGEMLVAAATRPARSLARVLNNAPFNLVALVDRALAYERNNRFPDATSFRQELAQVMASLGDEAPTKAELNPDAQILPATVHGEEAPETYEQAERSAELETFDPSTNSPEEIARMQKVFVLLERALVATKQYSPDHPEPKRRLEECFKELASALMTCELCLAWNFTPYAFVAGEEIVWEPESPWNRIPYQLFSDGVRTMGIAPGLDELEFKRWIEVITLDPTRDLAPEDDLVTRLWDAGFDHIFHQAIDSFAEGNQDQRARYEAERNAVINGAHVDHGRELAQSWQRGHSPAGGQGGGAGSTTRQILGFVNRSAPIDAEAAARAANLNLQDSSLEEAQAATALQLDPSTKALLAARLDVDAGATSDRFVIAAAEAFIAAAKMGRSQSVTAPLRRAVDGLGFEEPEKAMDMVSTLRQTVQVEGQELETENLRKTLVTEVLSETTLRSILQGSLKLTEDRHDRYLKGLTQVLEYIQSQHFETAIAFLPQSPQGKIRKLLLDFMQRAGQGYEARVGELFSEADLELGLDLVRLLVGISTPAAREAISMASNSPHALVRIEALGHLEGVSGTRVRNEMKKLLEDDQIEVRLAALHAMADHKIAAAGPFLVLRIQDRSFLKLPEPERRASLQTLSVLRPQRAEEICAAFLSETGLFRSSAQESTREMAIEFLAEVASNNKSFYLLDEISRSKPWSNSKRIREAAGAALARLADRAEKAEQEAKKAAERRTEARRSAATAAGTAGTGTGAPQGQRTMRKKKRPDGSTQGAPDKTKGPGPRKKRRPSQSGGVEPTTPPSDPSRRAGGGPR